MAKLKPPFVAAFTDDPDLFVKAATASSGRGWQRHHEAVMPYPLHAAFDAMGIRRSRLGRPVLFLLLFGAFLGFMMQYWMMKVDWPIFISGKPYNSWPAYVVITFESGVLMGAVGNLALLLLVFCKLIPNPCTKVLRQRCSDDQFALAVNIGEGRSEAEIKAFFADQGIDDCELFETEGREPGIPPEDPALRVPPGQMDKGAQA